MAKVLFVINIPDENNTETPKLGSGDKEGNGVDTNHNNEKTEEENGDVELHERLVDLPMNGVPAADTEETQFSQESGKDTDQKSLKKSNLLTANSKVTEKGFVFPVNNSDSANKEATLETIDETKASNAQGNENENKNKSEEGDEAAERRKANLRRGSLKSVGKGVGDDDKDDEEAVERRANLRRGSLKSVGKGIDNVDDNEDDKIDERETSYINFVSDGFTLLERVKLALELLDITAVNWSRTQDNVNVGMFIAGDGERCEDILEKLTFLDIGVIPRSSISVFPASVSIASVAREDQAEKLKLELEKENKLAEKVSEFKKSIKSRLVVAQVVDSVKSDAVFTFDFLVLVILASMVAIMGLLEASSVSLVASMLISPLMGPIIAFVFGAVIRNKELLSVGIRSESKGLALCIFVGFIAGLIPAGLESVGSDWRSTENWPTVEMAARGSPRALPVGVLIALPSGAGVALSILGGKVGSLVGVAISASLLPPAVNAGLLWANAIIVGILPPGTEEIVKVVPENSTSAEQVNTFNCPHILNNNHIPIYSCNLAVESAVLGVMSLLLTIVNIICIFIMGVIVLKIKEVAPMRLTQDAEKDFFAKDLKIARESYETTKGPNSAILGNKFLQEYKKFKEEIGVEDDSKYTNDELNDILEDVEEAEEVKEILGKLPHRPKRWSSYVEDKESLEQNQYHTFHGSSHKPGGTDITPLIRKRGSAYVSISPTRIEDDDKHGTSYLTVHHFVPTMEMFHSPRATHRSSGKFFTKKSKSRFHVAKVEEDGHSAPKVSSSPHYIRKDSSAPSSPTKVDIMPPIIESVPLLDFKSKEV